MTCRIEVVDDGPSLTAAQRQVVLILEAGGLSPRVIGRAELIVEEVALNALRHGGAAAVSLTAMLEGDGCALEFEDAGKAFDPSAASMPTLPRRLDEAPVGGLGLVLVHRLASSVRYTRAPEGRNLLRVTLAAS